MEKEKIQAITIEDDEAFLRQVSKPIDLKDKELGNYLEILEEYCNENEVSAMAAVQLGFPKRLIYLKNTNLELIRKINNKEIEDTYNEARVLINPIILSKEGLTDYWEACASCLDNMGHVKRPYKIKVEYYDKEGKKHTDTFEGFESTVLSHEMDHLDGILHMDIADEVLAMNEKERVEFRKTHDYHITSKTGSFEELLQKEN